MDQISNLVQSHYAAQEQQRQQNAGPVLSPEQAGRVLPDNRPYVPTYKSNLIPDEIQTDIINDRFDRQAYDKATDMMVHPEKYTQPQVLQPQSQNYNTPAPATNEPQQMRPDMSNIINGFKERLKTIRETNPQVSQPSVQNVQQPVQQQPEQKADMFDMFNTPTPQAQPQVAPTEAQTGMNNPQQNLPLADRMRSALNENEYNQINSGLEMSNDVVSNMEKFKSIARSKGYDPEEMQKKLLSMSQEEMIDILAGKYNAPSQATQNNNTPQYKPLTDLPGGTITNAPTISNKDVQTNQGRPYRPRWEI